MVQKGADVHRQTESGDAESAGSSQNELVGEDNPIPLGEIFDTLKNQRRRNVLHYLEEADSPVSISDLAEQIAAWENDKQPRLLTSSERKRVYVGLYQNHLPKMDDVGAVEYNRPRGIVAEGKHIDCFTPYLQQTDDESRRDRIYNYIQRLLLAIGVRRDS